MTDSAQSLLDEKFPDHEKKIQHHHHSLCKYILILVLTITLVIIAISYKNTLNSNQTQINNLIAQLGALNNSVLANISSVKTALTNSINSVQSDFNTLSGNVTTLQSDYTNITTTLSYINSNYSTLSATVTHDAVEISTLDDYSDLQDSVNNLNSEYKTQSTAVTNLQSNFSSVNNTVSNVSTIYTTINSQITTINGIVTALSNPAPVPLNLTALPESINITTAVTSGFAYASGVLNVTGNGYLSCTTFVVFTFNSSVNTGIYVELGYVLADGNFNNIYNEYVTNGTSNYAYGHFLIPLTTANNLQLQLEFGLQSSTSGQSAISSSTATANCYLLSQ